MAELFQTYDEALAARNQILDLIDDQAEATTDDQVFLALQVLRKQVFTSLPGDAQALPRQLTVTPPITLPALVIAHQIYEDASRADEIVTRNQIRYPGFVPGGQPLTVVSNG